MKKAAVALITVVAVALAGFVFYDGVLNKASENDFFSMNTYVTAKVTGYESDICAAEIQKIVDNLDVNILSRTSSESLVSSLNKNGFGEIDIQTATYFSLLLDVCEKSEGAFDFTLGGVSDLWQFGSNPSIPDENALAEALSHSGYEKIKLIGSTLTMQDKSAVLDFGASGKGIALDSAKAYLETRDIKNAVISVGGSTLLFGDKDFTVGIRNPEGSAGSYIAKLHVGEGCVSSSGSYEQFFEENGKRYHHILNPETGYPVDNGLVGVTIVSESGLLSDALSTACFVLGIEKGSALAAEYGCTAIFVTEDKKIYIEGDADIVEITDNTYSYGN
ncbi:MAG: FAD:protein FMN transferase [Clostridia bacterium]|nr:FAD:protein FMN transferase [Clostridia bacterium]